MNQTRSRVHKPTEELLVGVSAVEEHGQLGLLCQVKLLLKVSVTERREGEKINKEFIQMKVISGLYLVLYRQSSNPGIFPT